MQLGLKKMKNENYRIIRELGRGGMSIVYLAEHVELHSLWAVKQVFKDKWGTVSVLAEPEILKKLNHPMLPHIIDVFEEDTSLYIVEEYIEGESLQKYLDQKGPVDEAQAIAWMRDLCGVLAYLHNQTPQPIIYRDLKPSNIMLCGNQTIRLIDFGIARTYKTGANEDTTLAGTRGYAAPEQFDVDLQTDARADIYALGVTMYQILTGKRPQNISGEIASIRTVCPEVSPGLARIISKCTRANPEERYSTSVEILRNLDAMQNAEAGGGDEEEKQSEKSKGFLPVLLVGAFLLLVIAVFMGRYIFSSAEPDEDEESQVAGSSTTQIAAGSTTQQISAEIPEQDDPYRDMAAEVYSVLKSGDYRKLLEIDDGGLFDQLISSLETGDRYYLYAPEGEDTVFAVYQYGLMYYGGWKDGMREGWGLWLLMQKDLELDYEGTWKDDMPEGEGVVREYRFSRPEGWGELYPVYIESKGTFKDGYYDGEFQIKWEMNDESVREFTPVTYSMGVCSVFSRDDIYQWLIEHNYPPFQAEDMADEELVEMEETQSKSIAMCIDTVGRVFTLHENLIDGKDKVNDVFWIHDIR